LVIEKAIVFQLEFLIATRAALNAKKPGAEAGPERCVGGGAFLPDARHSNHGIAEGPVASREAEGDWGHVVMPAAATTIRLARRPSRLCYRSASRRVGKRLHVRCKRGEAFGGRRNEWRESLLRLKLKSIRFVLI